MIDGSGRELERRESGEDPYVLGVNSCPSGWLICCYEEPARRLSFCVMPKFADILQYYDRAERIAVGVPIGLPEGSRERCCDVEARRRLGFPLAAAVFRVPVRPAAYAESYAAALALSRERCGKEIFKATWAFCPKIVEVDRIMRPEMQERVFEAHREVCFWGIKRSPMRHKKKTPDGYEERRGLLSDALCCELAKRDRCHCQELGVEPSKLLDTAAAVLTAHRAFLGESERFPHESEIDAHGLRMEMVY